MPDGRQLLLYTSVRREEQPDGKPRDVQTQSVAVGDGLDYVKLAQNPVLDETCLPEGPESRAGRNLPARRLQPL